MGVYKNDIFLSYAHIDNQHFSDVEKGWIDYLHERLEMRLAQLLGKTPNIWRDRKLGGNDVFDNEILAELSRSAVMVSVLSPRYVMSHSCAEEVDGFCRLAEQQGGMRVGNKHRIFKVIKTDIPREKHPQQVQGLLGYEFYDKEQASGRVREFNHETGPGRDRRYWEKFEDLVWDIKETLLLLQTASGTRPAPPDTPYEKTIYLAETTADLSTQRDNIKRELTQHGYDILPPEDLPRNVTAQELDNSVRNYLKRSRLSIHLLGARYGFVPEGGARSIVRLQLDLTLERRTDHDFKRLIWIPKGLEDSAETEEAQKQFINDLLRDPSAQQTAELLRDKVEDLKTILHTMLKPAPNPVVRVTGSRSLASIYLICDTRDYEETSPLESYLTEQACEVLPSLSGSEDAQVSQYHRESLLQCDALLVYYNQASESWVQMKRLELLKLPGLGRTKPVLAKAFCISGDQTPPKERFRSNEAIVIKHYGEFPPESLAPFLAEISRAQSESP
jgi:hypothetical protein